MTTLIIRPRYKETSQPAVERRALVAQSLNAMPSDLSSRIEVLRRPEETSNSVQTSAFLEAADKHASERVRASATNDVVVEELIEFKKSVPSLGFDMLRAGPLDLADALRTSPTPAAFAGDGNEIEIAVRGPAGRRHVPIPFAEVHLVLSGSGGVREVMQERTDADGVVRFSFADFFQILSLVIVPYSEFWPKVVRGHSAGRRLDVLCERLPDNGPSGWWHKALGIRAERTSVG